MFKTAPQLMRLDALLPAGSAGVNALAARQGPMGSDPFVSAVGDFYLTNPIARASSIMAELSALKKNWDKDITGTHG